MKLKLALCMAILALLPISCVALDGEDEQAVINATFLFVQSAQSGTFALQSGDEDLYVLTLYGVAPVTIYFSDRPNRIVGQTPMQEFIDRFNFTLENPPNAAIEILDGDEERDVIVVELFDPVYDAAGEILQYKIKILEEPDHSYALFNERHDESLPETFGHVAVFIDEENIIVERPMYFNYHR